MKTTTEPRLLISVRSADEAAAALSAGADVIDVKEPSRGPLGKADDAVIDIIIGVAAGRAPVSVAMGELVDAPHTTVRGADYVKVGLAHGPADWRQRLVGRNLIPVAYADHERVGAPRVDDVIDFALRQHLPGVLIDTAVKDGRGLLDWCGAALPRWIAAARDSGVMIALAGSLAGEAIDHVAALGPDIIAVRGAACRGRDRNATIDPDRIAAIKHRLSGRRTTSAARAGRPVR